MEPGQPRSRMTCSWQSRLLISSPYHRPHRGGTARPALRKEWVGLKTTAAASQGSERTRAGRTDSAEPKACSQQGRWYYHDTAPSTQSAPKAPLALSSQIPPPSFQSLISAARGPRCGQDSPFAWQARSRSVLPPIQAHPSFLCKTFLLCSCSCPTALSQAVTLQNLVPPEAHLSL